MSDRIKKSGVFVASAAALTVLFAAGAEPLGGDFDQSFGLEYDPAIAESIERNGSDTIKDSIARFADRGGVRIHTAVETAFDALTP